MINQQKTKENAVKTIILKFFLRMRFAFLWVAFLGIARTCFSGQTYNVRGRKSPVRVIYIKINSKIVKSDAVAPKI